MEVVFRQVPCFSSNTNTNTNTNTGDLSNFSQSRSLICPKQQSNRKSLRSLAVSGEFSDKSHLQYYNNGARMALKEKETIITPSNKKEMKKKLKFLKDLSKNLSSFSDIGFGLNVDNGGLDEQVKEKMISEATEVLVAQLQKLKAEKMELKRKKKEEKAKRKMMECKESSSSSSSESDCERVVQLATSIAHGQSTSTSTSCLIDRPEEENVKKIMLSNNKIEVCMGGKCKKSGAEILLENFQKAVGIEGSVDVVGCKCMGKCRDGPNVKVNNNPLCIGVGLEDVDSIVTNFLGPGVAPVPVPAL